MWEIRQNAAERFEVIRDGRTLWAEPTRAEAMRCLVAAINEGMTALAAAGVAATVGDGLLPETWTSPTGIAFNEQPDPERDFTNTVWSSRDPNVSVLPLMLQIVEDIGHYGARWAGYMTSIDTGGDSPTATGRFYDNEDGIRARDMMLAGRSVGVSVDPGALDVEFTCTEEDEFGFCVAGVYDFLAYEIIGLTITPFPAFARAAISLEGATDAPEVPAVAASADVIALPRPIELPDPLPYAWFTRPEPEIGDPYLVRQPPRFPGDQEEHWAAPLEILDSGEVFGHVAQWGQCHVGYPQECITAPASGISYANFHLGTTATSDVPGSPGTRKIATGVLIARCDHAPLSVGLDGARHHYDNTALAWADVRAYNGEFGIWVCGALRPDVSPAALRVLRGSGLSGDWRDDRGTGLEMIAAQAVNVPGFPIAREAMAASGLALPTVHGPSSRTTDGRVVSLTAAGMVRRACPDCEARRAAQTAIVAVGGSMTYNSGADLTGRLDRIEATLARIDRRTAPLRDNAAAALVQRIGPAMTRHEHLDVAMQKAAAILARSRAV